MNNRNKKALIYLIPVILIVGIIVFLIIENEVDSTLKSWDMQGSTYKERHRIYNDILDCLDFGTCKEGLSVNIEGQKITINQKTCIEHKGKWLEESNYCKFRG